MRLSGLAAGIATFAVLEITHNVLRYWTKIGPGLNVFSLRPRDHRPAAGGGRRDASSIAVAFVYQRSRFGRQLRATRDDPAAAQAVGIWCYRQRLVGVRALGCARRVRGRPLRPPARRSTPTQLYLDLTFITLAMLVIGGMTSLWGAVVGALAVSGLDSLLAEAEYGLGVFGGRSTCRRARASSSSGC